MCLSCGCGINDELTTGAESQPTVKDGEPPLTYRPLHAHRHRPETAQPQRSTVAIAHDLLAKNRQLAGHNRQWLAERRIVALNLLSSPGSGKTTLLERTLRELRGQLKMAVIEGDQATRNDAERIGATGCPVVQINTGSGCHLDAQMLESGLEQLNPAHGSLLLIENVGNLICPALFDLGERAKVLILSVTEGEDKPLKYPHIFRASRLLLINKIDLLPHLDFDVERCVDYARKVNPAIVVLRVSAQSGEGMSAWYDWLQRKMADAQAADRDRPGKRITR